MTERATSRTRAYAHQIMRVRASAAPVLNLLLFGIALWVVDRVLRDYHLSDIVQSLRAVPPHAVALAAVISVLGYLALVGHDVIAFRFIGRPLAFRRMLLPSFVTFAVSNSAPASVVASSGVRYRLYKEHGMTPGDAAGVVAFNLVTYVVGLLTLTGVALVARPAIGNDAFSSRLLGGLLLALCAAYLMTCRYRTQPVHVLGRSLRFPDFTLALMQLGVSLADWVFSSGVLYVLLSSVIDVSWLTFLTTFLIAQFAALVLPVPGGIGVFEATVLLLRPPAANVPDVIAALLLFRVVYYLLPLLCAGLVLLAREIGRTRRQQEARRPWLDRLSALAPHALAFTSFLAGVVLLVTGTIPDRDRRLSWLSQVLPLAVIETSHFLASVVGAVLVVLAWGLERRVRLAYQLVRALHLAGILLALLRSLDLGVAAFLTVALAILLAANREFPRSPPLLREPMGAGWTFAVGAILLIDAWIGLLIYRQGTLSGETWWRFALFGQAPRLLRAAVGAGVVILLFLMARLLSRRRPEPRLADSYPS
jgi:phosphatidylglycerol lysyltransferase